MAVKVYTWDEYKGTVSKLVKATKSVFCRGHADESWKLQTCFHREAGSKDLTLDAYLDTVLPEVLYHVGAVRGEIIDLSNQFEFAAFLALLQHHGFPTPLLDWTLSPYVAAYFAFKEVHEPHPFSNNVKIHIFDYLEWTKTFAQPSNLRDMSVKYVSVLRPAAKYAPRMIAQQGAFTVTNVADMEEYIREREVATKKQFLYSALLSSKEKPAVLHELNLMGINEMTLFPSIDGICRAMKTRFFSADKIELTFSEVMKKSFPPPTIPDTSTTNR